jgi:hypothetical protein
MMEKKRSLGIIIVGLIILIYGALCLIIWRGDIIALLNPAAWIISIMFAHHILDGFIYLVASAFILISRDWSRKFTIVSSAILLLGNLPTAIDGLIHPVVFYPGNFFYLQPEIFGVNAASPDSFFSISLAVGIVYIPLILYCFLIYFFTRPKVREQFK